MKLRHTRTLATLVAGAGIAAAASLFAATPAQAFNPDAPPCYGATCVGKSPYIVNQAGKSCVSTAVDVANSTLFVYGDATITVRWSSWCAANWVTWRNDPTYGYNPGTNEFYIQSGRDHYLQYNSYGHYTPMADGTQIVQECYTYPGSGCLGWF